MFTIAVELYVIVVTSIYTQYNVLVKIFCCFKYERVCVVLQ